MRVIFCGGGTLGPVTPLVASIDALKEKRPDIVPVWVGSRKGAERAFIGKLGIEYYWISAGKLRRYFDLRTLLVPFAIAAAVVQSAWLIAKLKPKAVVVSGSFIQVPLVATARVLGVPVVLLQLDAEVGLANRMSSFDAKAIAVSLEASVPQFRGREAEVIGAPVRKLIASLVEPSVRLSARQKGYERWSFNSCRPTILVLGGGTGALGLNERIIRCLDRFLPEANVLLVAGKGKTVETGPKTNFVSVEFLNEEMAEAYAIADLVVCRAGLGTLSEIGVLGLPAVLVPLPGHQEKNAAYLAGKGAAIIAADTENDQVFADTILRLLHDRDRCLGLGRAASSVFPADAADHFAALIEKTLK